jgi:beta-glucanase (GH16 family)
MRQTATLKDEAMDMTMKSQSVPARPNMHSASNVFRLFAPGAIALGALLIAGCGGGSSSTHITPPTQAVAATPTIGTADAQNGAVVVTLATTTSGAAIYYTTDGSTPTASSTAYVAPFLVASNLTVNAIAVATGDTNSSVASKAFSPNIPSGTLVWADEFTNSTGANAQPNPMYWTYDTGAGGWGNDELETYCEWGSTTSPCTTSSPNAYVDTSGYLHISAQQPSAGVYTSARLKTEGLFSFQYGRIEFKAMVPEAQGFWPAAWLMGNNIASINWPACGEQDVMERVNAATNPDFNVGSVHGPGFTGSNLGTTYNFPSGQTAAQWHTYGMIWSKGSVSYYVDDPSTPYATYTPSSISSFSGSSWPFDNGPNFIIMNMAIGGQYPGPPNSSTPFPSDMLVDYVRIYTN